MEAAAHRASYRQQALRAGDRATPAQGWRPAHTGVDSSTLVSTLPGGLVATHSLGGSPGGPGPAHGWGAMAEAVPAVCDNFYATLADTGSQLPEVGDPFPSSSCSPQPIKGAPGWGRLRE